MRITSLFCDLGGRPSDIFVCVRLIKTPEDCEFLEISKNTSFTEHLWATASETRQIRRRLKVTF